MRERSIDTLRRHLRDLRRQVDPVILDNTLESLNEAWQKFGGPDGTQVTRDDAENLWLRNYLAGQRLQGQPLSTHIDIPDAGSLVLHFIAELVQFQAIMPDVRSEDIPELQRRITACTTAIEILQK